LGEDSNFVLMVVWLAPCLLAKTTEFHDMSEPGELLTLMEGRGRGHCYPPLGALLRTERITSLATALMVGIAGILVSTGVLFGPTEQKMRGKMHDDETTSNLLEEEERGEKS
jgi:hypothetical protein